jgi:hypothetical protein
MDKQDGLTQNDSDFMSKLLTVTRNQLYRMISLNAELEVLLLQEQDKVAKLAEQLTARKSDSIDK